jgi:LPS-assembly protein
MNKRALAAAALIAQIAPMSVPLRAWAADAAPVGAAEPKAAPPKAAPALLVQPELLPSTELRALPRAEGARGLPIILRARSLQSQLDNQVVAEGEVEFRRAGVVIKADRLVYDADGDQARASGHVRVSRDGAVYTGPALSLGVQRFEGFFEQPTFEFFQRGAGGRAQRLDFISASQAVATDARYTSCPRDGAGADAPEPAWELRTDKVFFDTQANEGVAEGARLRFLGTTILALPTMSFPISDARKSGWLPPSVSLDSRGGLELQVPYYLNLAPNRDLTLTPRAITRRGLGLNAEFRYLEPTFEGSLMGDGLPEDRVAGRSRHSVQWLHESRLPLGLRLNADLLRVSDNDWWKDFPKESRNFTSRLLPSRLSLERALDWPAANGHGLVYLRSTQWQVLQAADSFITAPYQRAPQVGLRFKGQVAGWEWDVEGEYNRFTLPPGQGATTQRSNGERLHALGTLSHPWRGPGWWLVPALGVNAARYSMANTGSWQQRMVPTFSLDAGIELERDTEAFGRALHQTLEPRLLYVNTPYRAQSALPNYDAVAKDFNFTSIYSDNTFSGVDRVADLDQLTAGVTTRLVDASTGAEALRLGLVQRVLFRTQRVTARADGTADGPALTQRFSDALLLGSTSVLPGWTLDAAAQYSPDINRSIRSIVGARYSPGAFRTVSATYRLTRGLSEQMELGWQWPVWGVGARFGSGSGAGPGSDADVGAAPNTTPRLGRAIASAGRCQGTWYAVGRVNYSVKDRRVTDSVMGVEYDAGCWIGRFVAEQLSTGRSEATTRYMIQLELVGLSRLGSNPLKVLKDNIPGYRLLREDRNSVDSSSPVRNTLSPLYE